MKDRYLFKAKKMKGGEWVTGNLVLSDDVVEGFQAIIIPGQNSNMYISDTYSELGVENWYQVDPSTVCRCTGLKDKNGKPIWEHDIVAYTDSTSTDNGYAEVDCIGEVVWDDETMSFQITERMSAESYEVANECVIIGNIFDIPAAGEEI